MVSNTGTPELKTITTKYNLVIDSSSGKKKIPISLPNSEWYVLGVEYTTTKSTPTSVEFDKSWTEPLYDNTSLAYIESLCSNILEMTIVNGTQLKAAKKQLHDAIENYGFKRTRFVLELS